MLIIRKEQMAILGQHARRKFADRMVRHLKKHFPERCRPLSDQDLRTLIDQGITDAAAHKITKEKDVCKFTDLMLVFGRHFDTQYSWATAILTSDDLDGTAKMDRLFATAIKEAAAKEARS